MSSDIRTQKLNAPVTWSTRSSDELLGHGVEFRHRAIPNVVVAFAVGYDWLHCPGTPVTVAIVDTKPASLSDDEWREIVEETKSDIQQYFSGSAQLTSTFGRRKVSAWYNA